MVRCLTGVPNYNKTCFGSASPKPISYAQQGYPPEDEMCYAQYPPEEKHGSFIGFLAKTALVAGVAGGALVGARKWVPALKNCNIAEKLTDDAKFGEKCKYYTASAGEKVETWTKQAYNYVKGVFKEKEKAETPEAAGGKEVAKEPEKKD